MPTNDSDKSNPLLNESGFTLLEIIAVLVILSILAVVAVPKYFDLQAEAKKKALATALAEGVGRINGYFAQRILAGDTPGQINYGGTGVTGNMGDFTMTLSGDGYSATPAGTNFTIKVIGKTGTALAGASTTKTIARPGRP
jgi:MSHA pilin protein MshA